MYRCNDLWHILPSITMCFYPCAVLSLSTWLCCFSPQALLSHLAIVLVLLNKNSSHAWARARAGRPHLHGLQRSGWSPWIIWPGPSLCIHDLDQYSHVLTTLTTTVHWVQLTKIEDFHWTRLFSFTSGKVSAATRSEPSSGRSLRMSMALTPLVLGLNDWLPLLRLPFLEGGCWIGVNQN